jgi:hypothetical protein
MQDESFEVWQNLQEKLDATDDGIFIMVQHAKYSLSF